MKLSVPDSPKSLFFAVAPVMKLVLMLLIIIGIGVFALSMAKKFSYPIKDKFETNAPGAAEETPGFEQPNANNSEPEDTEPAPKTPDEPSASSTNDIYTPKPRAIPYDGMLDNIKDKTPHIEQDTPYNYFLTLLHRMTDQEIAKQLHPTLNIKSCLRYPNNSRGEFIRVQGVILDICTVKLPGTIPVPNLIDVYEVWGWDNRPGGGPFVVHMLQKSPYLELERDVFVVDGLFFKLIQYRNRKGEDIIAPLLIARKIAKIETKPSEAIPLFIFLIIGVLALTAIIIGVGVWITRRRDIAFEEKLQEFKKKRAEMRTKGFQKVEPAEPSPASKETPPPS